MMLGLLHGAPMHGYDILKHLVTIHAETWTDVLPGLIFHALKQMERDGLLAVEATERSGSRERGSPAHGETSLRGGGRGAPRSFSR